MKTFSIASVTAAALSGALFATSVIADLPPIVIKVCRPCKPTIFPRELLVDFLISLEI